jgi:hypothetical protein
MKANIQLLQIPLFHSRTENLNSPPWSKPQFLCVTVIFLVNSFPSQALLVICFLGLDANSSRDASAHITSHIQSNTDSICDVERCAQCHQQRREVRKAPSHDPTFLKSYRQVPQCHAKARYVCYKFFFFLTFGMITR